MDQSLLLPVFFGALGGFVRALVGGIAGVFANGDWKLTLIVGYAGTDFLEGLYKIKKAQGFEI